MWWYFDSALLLLPYHLFILCGDVCYVVFDLGRVDSIIYRLYDTHIGGSDVVILFGKGGEEGHFRSGGGHHMGEFVFGYMLLKT